MKKGVLFVTCFVFALIFWRVMVFLKNGDVSFWRGLTGLNIHHYHYGILLVLIGVLLLVFKGVSKSGIVLTGLGLGTSLDGFISSLLPSVTRAEEIFNYQQNLVGTIVLFLGIVLITLVLARKNH